MYKFSESDTSSSPEKFEMPFEGKLSDENRWVIMAELIPWSECEEEYAQNFAEEMGAPAKSFRMALGALIIKEKLGISDREVVEQIRENPYLQYFIGRKSYSNNGKTYRYSLSTPERKTQEKTKNLPSASQKRLLSCS